MNPPKGKTAPLITDKQFQSYLTSRGCPEGVVYGGFPTHFRQALTRIDIDPENKINKALSSKQQESYIERTVENPFGSNYVMCVAGETNDAVALQLGLYLFTAAIRESAKLASKPRVLWHRVYGNTKDDLRDGSPLIDMTAGGSPELLVLSNIYANSTMMKVEKVRDILSRYDHIPRIIILAGGNPITYCSKVLFTAINRVVYFGTKNGV